VDYAMHQERGGRRWVITHLHASSPTITVNPLLADEETITTIATGIHTIMSGTEQPPQYFTEQALTDLIRMRRLFRGRDRALSIAVAVDDRESATIREDIHQKATRILAASYWNLGTIEGRLEAINLHRIPSFTIWDRVSRAPVRCSFPSDAEWKSRVKDHLERRVFVKGKVRYFVNGVPRSIAAIEDLWDATPDPTLPKAEFGSIPDKEAARDPVAFLRGIRGPQKE